jgi:hypothetical protein
MPNRTPLVRWADIIPIGPIVIICGISALTILFQNLVIACLVGLAGVAIGIAALRIDTKESDKLFAMIGIILSLVPIIYAAVILVQK